MDQGQAILVTAVAGIVTTILGFVVQLYRERRNRQWDLEDRRQIKDTAATAVQVAAETREVLVQKIEENTQINVDALTAATDVSKQIAAVSTMIDEVKTREGRNSVEHAIKEAHKQLDTLEIPRAGTRSAKNDSA